MGGGSIPAWGLETGNTQHSMSGHTGGHGDTHTQSHTTGNLETQFTYPHLVGGNPEETSHGENGSPTQAHWTRTSNAGGPMGQQHPPSQHAAFIL